jgi:hypothetical protein
VPGTEAIEKKKKIIVNTFLVTGSIQQKKYRITRSGLEKPPAVPIPLQKG